jgi:DNA-binding beta-propeller fold protein YncE
MKKISMKLAVVATILSMSAAIFAQPLKYAYKSTFVQTQQVPDPTMRHPHNIVVDMQQGNLYVSDPHGSNQIFVFAPDNTFLYSFFPSVDGTYNVGRPLGLAFDTQGKLFVVDQSWGDVKVFEKNGDYIKTFVTGFDDPRNIAIDANDKVYVTNSGNSEVLVFDVSGTLILTIDAWIDEHSAPQSFSKPYGVLIDNASQLLYVSDVDRQDITVFDLSGNYVKTISEWNDGGTPTHFLGPRGMCFDNSMNLLIADHDGRYSSDYYIIGLNPTTGSTVFSFQTDDPIPSLVLKSNGNILAAASPCIIEYSTTGSVIAKFNKADHEFSYPHDMVYDAQGNLYVSATRGNGIFVFAPNGNILRSFYVGGNPNGLAFDSQENLFVVDLNGSVEVYNKNGTFIKTFVSGLDNPKEIAIDANNNIYITDQSSVVLIFNAAGIQTNIIDTWTDEHSISQSFNKPYGVFVDNTNQLLYVSDANEKNIVVFDLSGNYVKTFNEWNDGGTPTNFVSPRGMCFDNSGNLLFVDNPMAWNSQDARVIGLNPTTGNTVFAFQTYIAMPSLICKSNGNILITAPWLDKIIEYSPTGNLIGNISFKDITSFDSPNSIVFDAADNAYITTNWGDICVLSPDGVLQKTLYSPYGFNSAHGMAFDNRGLLWVCNARDGSGGDGNVQIINTATDKTEIFVSETEFDNPNDVVFDKQNNAYIVEVNSQKIKVFSQDGNTSIRTIDMSTMLGGNIYRIRGLVMDDNENLYVTAEKFGGLGSCIVMMDKTGNFIREIGAAYLVRPFGVKISPEGYLAVADVNEHVVFFYDTLGNFITSIGYYGDRNQHFDRPRGINFDSKGNLYVCDQWNNRVQLWEPVRLTGFNGYVYSNKTTTVNVPSLFPAKPLHEDLMPYPIEWFLKDSLQDTTVFNGAVTNTGTNFSFTIPQVTKNIVYTLFIGYAYAEYDFSSSSWLINPTTDTYAGYLEVSATMTAGYTITASACANATISPSGTIDVAQGENKTFILTADSNYKIKTVLVDGVANTSALAGTYTFTNIQENHTIEITAVESVNIAEAKTESDIKVYPNPTS